MKQIIRLTESDLHRVIKESVKKVLRETRLDYNEDNFNGAYNKNMDDEEWYGEEVYALNVDDRGYVYKLGKMPIETLWLCQSEVQRYGQGHDSIDSFNNEKDYIKAINDYVKKGYTISN